MLKVWECDFCHNIYTAEVTPESVVYQRPEFLRTFTGEVEYVTQDIRWACPSCYQDITEQLAQKERLNVRIHNL